METKCKNNVLNSAVKQIFTVKFQPRIFGSNLSFIVWDFSQSTITTVSVILPVKISLNKVFYSNN